MSFVCHLEKCHLCDTIKSGQFLWDSMTVNYVSLLVFRPSENNGVTLKVEASVEHEAPPEESSFRDSKGCLCKASLTTTRFKVS